MLPTTQAIKTKVGLQPISVMSPGLDYLKMVDDWDLPDALWNGTDAMRGKRTKYLPQNEGESNKAYEARLNRTFLYPVYKATIQKIVGQAFLNDVVVDNVPPELEYLARSFDAEGRSITEVASECLTQQFMFGKTHGLVDYPNTTGIKTLADARKANIRPYFTPVDPRDFIAWKYEKAGGEYVLTQARIQEIVVEPLVDGNGVADPFAEVEVYQVRVFFDDRVEVYRSLTNSKNESGAELIETFPFTLGRVPLVTAYGEKTGFLMGKSPLQDLAWLSLQHWQSSSDQNNILHVARVPVFFAKGFEEGELSNTTIGANRGIVTTSENADLSYVEHSGAAIDSGQKSLEHLESQMSRTTASVLDTTSVARQTAGARETDRVESMSIMQTMIDSLETMLQDVYRVAGEWIGVDASNVKVKIAEEFTLRNDDPNPVDALERAGLTPEAMLEELKRRNIVSKDTTIDAIDKGRIQQVTEVVENTNQDDEVDS